MTGVVPAGQGDPAVEVVVERRPGGSRAPRAAAGRGGSSRACGSSAPRGGRSCGTRGSSRGRARWAAAWAACGAREHGEHAATREQDGRERGAHGYWGDFVSGGGLGPERVAGVVVRGFQSIQPARAGVVGAADLRAHLAGRRRCACRRRSRGSPAATAAPARPGAGSAGGSAARSPGRPRTDASPGCGSPGCPGDSPTGTPWGRCSRGARRAPRCAARCRCRWR